MRLVTLRLLEDTAGARKTRKKLYAKKKNPAAMSEGPHPYPSRTRKLSPLEPMVLHGRLCGRVGSCRNPFWALSRKTWQGSFFFSKKISGVWGRTAWNKTSLWRNMGWKKFIRAPQRENEEVLGGWLWKITGRPQKKSEDRSGWIETEKNYFIVLLKKRWIPRANCHLDYYFLNIHWVIWVNRINDFSSERSRKI